MEKDQMDEEATDKDTGTQSENNNKNEEGR